MLCPFEIDGERECPNNAWNSPACNECLIRLNYLRRVRKAEKALEEMSRVEERYRCPACGGLWKTYREAVICRNRHPIKSELWAMNAVSRKAVRINENCTPDGYGGIKWALREANLSDNKILRKKQLEAIKGRTDAE